jgi:adenylate cyclase
MNTAEAAEIEPVWSRHPVATWLARTGNQALDGRELIAGLCEQLNAHGMQLLRVSMGLPALHPLLAVRNLRWTRGQPVEEEGRGHGISNTAMFRASPLTVLNAGAAAIRRRLTGPDAQMDFPILTDMRALGATDYVIFPMRFIATQLNFCAFATDRPEGFTAGELELLHDLIPLIALRFEPQAARQATRDLLTTYLGRSAAHDVLEGDIRRGTGRTIRAAIWSSDLRGFTALADRLSAHDLITTLDAYFDAVSSQVDRGGGEILKFVGDGVLAIFRGEDEAAACLHALDAAQATFAALHELNMGRAIGGGDPLRIGVGLHIGEVVWGNVGASDRLDFTVIGAAVNEVVRTEGMCKVLDRPLLATAAFAALLPPGRMESMGQHLLRGKLQPTELFGAPLASIAGYG